MKNKKIWMMGIILLISISAANSFDPKINDWDEVLDWELEFCQKWGGTTTANDGVSGFNNYLSQLTITLQGEKTEKPFNITLYEIGFYLYNPNNNTQFKIGVRNKNTGNTYLVADTATANVLNGAKLFDAFETNETYHYVDLLYWVEGAPVGTLTLTVPIVDKSGYYDVPKDAIGENTLTEEEMEDW